MKTSYLVGGIIVVILLAGAVWYTMSMQNSGADSSATTSANTMPVASSTATTNANTPTTGTASATTPTAAATPAPQHFSVNGNDETADLETITVPKGTPVTITFGADAGSTYHGGLDFRSSVVSTGTITPGSTKTVSFTAEQSLSFQPYWPATNIAKPYKISIIVD